MDKPILTDARGVPFERPVRGDFADDASYLRAAHAFNDEVANEANRAFGRRFAEVMTSGGAPGGAIIPTEGAR